jgi:hypothetical protein
VHGCGLHSLEQLMKPTGYLVMESCEDYEQALCLRTGGALPKGEILSWAAKRTRDSRAMFASRADAKAAIKRTEHYRLAFGYTDLPEEKMCSVVPVCAVAGEPS